MEERREIKVITFSPNKIIEFIEKKGFITAPDVNKECKCDEVTGIMILYALEGLSVIRAGEDFDFIENIGYLKWYLAADYKSKKICNEISFNMGTFPIFTKFFNELWRELEETAKARGMDVFEMVDQDYSAKLQELIGKEKISILGEYTPEQIKEFGREFHEFLRGHQK